MRYQLPLRYVDAVARIGSIRKAADSMAISSTALNRRVLAFEEDLGVKIFERLPNGVRLSAAGEVLIKHIRSQLSDMDRVLAVIEDMEGERRGHINLVSSQSAMVEFIPRMIAQYRDQHPAVTFDVKVCTRQAAEQALTDFSADVAVVFEPDQFTDVHSLINVEQPVYLVVHKDHALAGLKKVRLSEISSFPLALPTQNNGLRVLLEKAALRASTRMRVAIESDNFGLLSKCLDSAEMVSFQIPIGLPEKGSSLVSIPVDQRDVSPGSLFIVQLRGRTLPVAAARFAEQMVTTLQVNQSAKAS